MKDLVSSLFASLLIEVLVVVVALIVKDDKRKMLAVFLVGTVIAGLVWARGEWPPSPIATPMPGINGITAPPGADENSEVEQSATLPAASKTPEYQTVSLQQVGTPESSNLGLKAGINNLGGIPFETGWTVTTQAVDRPDLATIVQLDTSIPRPVEVYLLIQAGWGMQQFAGKQVGTASLYFSTDEHLEVPLILGANIRDWSRNNPSAVNTVTSADLREVWRGSAPNGEIGGMDVLTLRVPSENRDFVLSSVRIVDTSSQTADSQNPCFHLLAITVMHLR